MEYKEELKRDKIIKKINEFKQSIDSVHKSITGISDNYWRQHLMGRFQTALINGNHKATAALLEDRLRNPPPEEAPIQRMEIVKSWILWDTEQYLLTICKGCGYTKEPDKCEGCAVIKFLEFKESLREI